MVPLPPGSGVKLTPPGKVLSVDSVASGWPAVWVNSSGPPASPTR